MNYLETLTKPNVSVVYGEVEKITEKGCVCDDGNEYPIDVLICATGFDTTSVAHVSLESGTVLTSSVASNLASHSSLPMARICKSMYTYVYREDTSNS